MSSVEGPEPRRSLSRPRSPIPRIKQLLSIRRSLATRSPPEAEFSGFTIPTEIIANVGRHITSLPDIVNISLTLPPAKIDRLQYWFSSSQRLFDFRGLVKFSLTVNSDSLDWLSDGRPNVEKLPRRCWQMLLEHCPNLEELAIGGSAPSPRVFDTRHVTAGRWPRLRKLSLGDVILLPSTEVDGKRKEQALSNFLVAHLYLQEIDFLHPGGIGFPSTLSLPRSTLLQMHSFSGPFKYIKAIPNLSKIQTLRITTLHHCLSAFPPTYAMLRALTCLTSLTIWIDLSFANRHAIHDDESIFRTLLECCHPPSKYSASHKEFSAALCRSPQLRSFSLTKIHNPNDEDMSHTAARIAHDNPNIQRFNLRYTPESWLTHTSGRVKQYGTYEILAGEDGLGTTLLAYEWGLKTFGTYSRHYTHTLKPPKNRRSSASSLLSWSSYERARSPRPQSPQSVLSFNSLQPSTQLGL
ncbi:hypothetical protein DXG03_006942 [Asterophora parasitica]|uniref:Uncharacterized protein n=1 Tax=Asterophora parasitica TaxID=117018 RepID=A0A9P7KAF3_9AGAR|nr:hypothetical protein DXG03_006942 [Asterophora parasitica]